MSQKYKEIENVLTDLIPVKCLLLGATIFVKNLHKFSCSTSDVEQILVQRIKRRFNQCFSLVKYPSIKPTGF